jgi:hypothetical protein
MYCCLVINTRWHKLFCQCFILLHSASFCFNLLHFASTCFTLLQLALTCFNLLQTSTLLASANQSLKLEPEVDFTEAV